VIRYIFDVGLFHSLLHAGCPALSWIQAKALDDAHTVRARLGDGDESDVIGPDDIDKLREPAKRLAAWRRLITHVVESVTVAPAMTAEGQPSRLGDPRRIDRHHVPGPAARARPRRACDRPACGRSSASATSIAHRGPGALCLQVAVDRAASKQLGDSGNLGKAGPRADSARRPHGRPCDARVWRWLSGKVVTSGGFKTMPSCRRTSLLATGGRRCCCRRI